MCEYTKLDYWWIIGQSTICVILRIVQTTQMDLDTLSEWSVDDDIYSVYSNQFRYRDAPILRKVKNLIRLNKKQNKYDYDYYEEEDDLEGNFYIKKK